MQYERELLAAESKIFAATCLSASYDLELHPTFKIVYPVVLFNVVHEKLLLAATRLGYVDENRAHMVTCLAGKQQMNERRRFLRELLHLDFGHITGTNLTQVDL